MMAEAVVDRRLLFGPYQGVDELLEVPGMTVGHALVPTAGTRLRRRSPLAFWRR